MSELVVALTVALFIAGGIYLLLEFRETYRANRDGPRAPVSGPESLIGRKVKVLGVFEPSQDKNKLLGRVLIDGEDWSAEMDGRLDDAPEIGAQLEVFAVEPSKLKVHVRGVTTQ